MHVDIDAFFASVEQVRNPALRGRPVIVGNGCIASCSYEARRYGLSAGMSLSEARARCPRVVILDGSEKVYRCYGDAIFGLCRELSPVVEAHLDEAYLDLRGMERIYPDPREPARWLRREVRERTGLAVTVGIGSNRMIARLATAGAKPDGLGYVAAGDELACLAGRPVGDLPGVGPTTARALAEVNVETVEQLRELPRELLRALFGKNGEALFELCRGRDARDIGGREIPRSISRATTFHQPTSDRGEIEGMLCYLVERAMRTAREQRLAPRTVKVSLRYQDGPGCSQQRSLPRPTETDDDVQRLARQLLELVFVRRVHVRLVGVALSGFQPTSTASWRQLELFDEEGEDGGSGAREGLTRAIDGLRQKYGHAVLVGGRSIELLGKLQQETYGFVLRTPSLTK